jgi:hypothetical protein
LGELERIMRLIELPEIHCHDSILNHGNGCSARNFLRRSREIFWPLLQWPSVKEAGRQDMCPAAATVKEERGN